MTQAKKSFFWNMAGSTCNALSNLLLLILVTRISGTEAAGIFSIGYAVATLMWSVGTYDQNTYQLTDVKNLFSFGNYYAFKIITCLAMLVASVINIALENYDSYKAAVALLLCVYKAIDAYSGIYYTLFQKSGRLDLSGLSLTVRVVLSVTVFTAVLFAGLIPAIIAACVISAVWVAAFEMRIARKYADTAPKFEFKKLSSIALQCAPLFISSFILNYINNIPKYAINDALTNSHQAFYNIIFMPAFVINLFSLFFLRPVVTSLADYWDKRQIKTFILCIIRQFGFILAFTAAALVGAYFLGIPVLNIVYGKDISPYKLGLLIILLAGGINAMLVAYQYILTVMRKQKFLLAGYIAAALTGTLISGKLVLYKPDSLVGASLIYLISMAVAVICFTVIFIIFLKKHTKNN
ncbi:MAG: lipopolysaccharide biosynthesis protein [Oscillospiraceae bacterium]